MNYFSFLAIACLSTLSLYGQTYYDAPAMERDRMNPAMEQPVNPNMNALCQQFAQILQGKPMITNGVCVVMRPRPTGTVTIGGRPTQSPLVNTAMFSFENLDAQGIALNLGETGLLQEEVEPFLNALLSQKGIVVTALHNHWLNTNPPVIMYMHWYYIGNPIDFAQKVENAWKVLKR